MDRNVEQKNVKQKEIEPPMLYLDFAASTPLWPRALGVLTESMKNDYANPSSAHRVGRELHRRVEGAREKLLTYLGAGADDRLVFTASATESNNMLIRGLGLTGGDRAGVCLADHPSVVRPLMHLKEQGLQVDELPLTPDGTPDEGAWFRLVPRLKLLVLTHVNNQSGVVTDMARLGREIKKINPGIHIHADAVQGFGKIPFSLADSGIDSLSISAHKLGGPRGVAALYLRSGVTVEPLLYGGGQEGGLRSSTATAPLIFSFLAAVEDSMEDIQPALERTTHLYRLARRGLEEKIETVEFPFSRDAGPYILTFLLPGISSDIVLRHLEQQGIMISSTSACSSRSKGANPVFSALRLPPEKQKFVLRVSFFHHTTEDDVRRFCDTLGDIYNHLKMYVK